MPATDAPELLVLYASIGSGHEMAAAAIAEQALALGGERVRVRELDLLSLARLPRKKSLGAVPSMPRLGALYDAIWGATWLGTPVGAAARLTRPALFPHLAEHLSPATRVVVSTHALGAQLTARLAGVRRVGVMTDLMPHAFWPRQLDVLCVSTPEARDALLRRDFTAEQIALTGIPIRSQFAAPPARTDARAALGLAPDRAIALVAAGADDPGPYTRMARGLGSVIAALLAAGFFPLVLTGTDAELLGSVRSEFGERVCALPFTDDMATPLAAADLVVAKPGGSLVAECLACGRPLMLLARGRGQERANSEYLERAQVAFIADTPTLLAETLARFARERDALAAMGARAASLGRPEAAKHVATQALAGVVEGVAL